MDGHTADMNCSSNLTLVHETDCSTSIASHVFYIVITFVLICMLIASEYANRNLRKERDSIWHSLTTMSTILNRQPPPCCSFETKNKHISLAIQDE